MNKHNIWAMPEEDMDFMPIIPLNEGEGENIEEADIPADLPILPLRNTVLFPGVVIPITVGRDKSIKAVNEAYKTDKLVGVLAQKDSSVEDPQISDLVEIGTVAKIIKLIKMPDGGTTVIIQGTKRFQMRELVMEDPYFRARIDVLQEEELKEDEHFKATVD
ncbi:MAG: LON peptidase substrate-binding domain-containing protein, partial [Sphingobacteriales bacterium]